MNWTLSEIPALDTSSSADAEPLTLDEAKVHLQVQHNADDALISRLITAAREYCEAFTNRIIGERQFVQAQESFPWSRTDSLRLYAAPLLSVEQVEYMDLDGATTSWADFELSTPANAYGSIRPQWGEPYPVARCQPDAVAITYTAGGPASASVIAGILLLIRHLYENREAVLIDKSAVVLPLAVESLWTPYRIF